MSSESGEPRSALEFLGQQLRRLRQERGWTQDDVAEKLHYSAQYVGHIENGRRLPNAELIAAAEELFDAGGVLAGARKLAYDQATRAEQITDFFDAEARASEIFTYEAHLIPGLLQTEKYARAVVDSTRPPLPPGEVDTRVALRLDRAEILSRPDPPQCWFIIDEACLYQQLCSTEVLREQLRGLLEVPELSSVTVQVLPFVGPSPVTGHSFNLLGFPNEPDLVYCDHFGMGIYHRDNVDVVARFRSAAEYLKFAALSVSESTARIEKRLKELR